MHNVTHQVKDKLKKIKTDAATKAGILRIFEHTGHVKTLKDLRDLTEQEQHWFSLGVEHYLEDQEHLVRRIHKPRHFGRAVFYLSLLYFMSIVIWLFILVHFALHNVYAINWEMVWGWIIAAVILNLCLSFYGIYLEVKILKNQINLSQRIVAIFAIIALVVAIMGNILLPLTISISALGSFIK